MRQNLEKRGFWTQKVWTDRGVSLDDVPWHRAFSIQDGGTCPELQSHPSEGAKQDDPEDRTSKDFRILKTVTIKMGSSVTTSAAESRGNIEYDTIGLTYNGNGKVYEGSWDIGKIVHEGSVVCATSVRHGEEMPVEWLGGSEWNALKLKAQGSIIVTEAEYSDWKSAVSQWESQQLRDVEADPKAQAIVNDLIDS